MVDEKSIHGPLYRLTYHALTANFDAAEHSHQRTSIDEICQLV